VLRAARVRYGCASRTLHLRVAFDSLAGRKGMLHVASAFCRLHGMLHVAFGMLHVAFGMLHIAFGMLHVAFDLPPLVDGFRKLLEHRPTMTVVGAQPVPSPGADVAGVSPVPVQMLVAVSPVPVQMLVAVSPVLAQMWAGGAQSRRRCATGAPSRGADVAGLSPVPLQMCHG
jgi:hypothetical protein